MGKPCPSSSNLRHNSLQNPTYDICLSLLLSLGQQSYCAPTSLFIRQGIAAYRRTPPPQRSRSKMGEEHPCSRDELAQQLFKTDDLPRPGWARPHRPWLPGPQQRPRASDACRRQLGAMTDLRCERQLEPAISRTAAAIATSPTTSTNPRMLDSSSSHRSRRRPCRRSLAVPQDVSQSTESNRHLDS